MRNFKESVVITVNCADLLKTLEVNREKHIKDYKEALRNWKLECISRLAQQLDVYTNYKEESLLKEKLAVLDMPPQDMSAEYTKVINMLKWNKSESIELDQEKFQALVMDEWDWKQHWSLSNSKYLSS